MRNGTPLTGASSAASIAFQPRCAPQAVQMPPGSVEGQAEKDARQRDVPDAERGDVGLARWPSANTTATRTTAVPRPNALASSTSGTPAEEHLLRQRGGREDQDGASPPRRGSRHGCR